MGERSSLRVLPGTIPLRALTDVLPSPDSPLPLLILDQRPEMAVRSGPTGHVNSFVSTLLSMGLTPGEASCRFPRPAQVQAHRPPGPGVSCPVAG